MAELIIFDLDGTLTDSGPGIINCVEYAFEKLNGSKYDREQLKAFVGPPLYDQFKATGGLTHEEALKAVELYRERYTDIGIFENSVYDGIPEVLEFLKMSGKKLAVGSSKPHHFVLRVLEHYDLTHYFDYIRGSAADGPKTEKAEVLKDVLELAGYTDKKDQAVLVGDRKYDVYGAHKAGIRCLGVTYGYGTKEELKEAGADKICKHPGDLVLLGWSEI